MDIVTQEAPIMQVLELVRRRLPPRLGLPSDLLHGATKAELNSDYIRQMMVAVGEHLKKESVAEAAGIVNLPLCLSLAQVVASLPDLVHLQIAGLPKEVSSEAREQGMCVLFGALVLPSTKLRILGLAHCETFGSERVCAHLALVLRYPRCRLENLVLKRTGMRADGVRHIAEALQANTTVTKLYVVDCPDVGDEGVEHLSAMLPNNRKVEELHLSGIGLTGVGTLHLSHALSQCSSTAGPRLKCLDLSDDRLIGQDGAEHLGNMLAHNSSLEKLWVVRCNLEDRGGRLAEGLCNNHTLKELHMTVSSSKMGKTGFEAFFRGVASNVSLTSLKLAWPSGEEMPPYRELGEMLAHNRTLETLLLDLDDDDDGGKENRDDAEGHVAQGLQYNSTLKTFHILEESVGKRGLELLIKCLASHTTLQELKIGFSGHAEMPRAGDLALMLSSNRSLRKLVLRGARYSPDDWADVVLPGENQEVREFQCINCSGIDGDQVFYALVKLIRASTVLENIHLHCKLRTLETQNIRLTTLHIKRSPAVGDAGMELLAAVLRSNPTVQELTVGVAGVQLLAAKFRKNSILQVLKLTRGEDLLAAVLHKNATLQELKLSRNIILHAGMPTLPGVCELLPSLLSPGNPPTLTQLEVTLIFDDKVAMELMGSMAGALLLDTTWTSLRVADDFRFKGTSFWPESVCAGFAAMLRENSTLRVLEFPHTEVRFNKGVAHALSQNRSLEKVKIALDGDGSNALFRSLSDSDSSGGPNGGPLTLHTLHLVRAVGDAKALAHMLATNKTLQHLNLQKASYAKEDWALYILPALASNTTLQILVLSKCEGVDEQLVYKALMDLLWINTSIQDIRLSLTPLYRAGKAEAVKEAVRRNVVYRAALKHVPTIPPKSCRLVLCGYPDAGKTTLVETMLRLLTQGHVEGEVLTQPSTRQEEELRTRRYDITTLMDDQSLRICAWDFAGHQEYYALHDCIFPVVNGSSVFLFAFNPARSGDSHGTDYETHGSRLYQDLEYWLRFIASNSQLQHSMQPNVVVVITHQDLREAKMNVYEVIEIVGKLARAFRHVIRLYDTPFLVDGFSQDHVKLIWDTIHRIFQDLVKVLPRVPVVCEHFQLEMEKWSYHNGNNPIISMEECCAQFQAIDVTTMQFEEGTNTSCETLDRLSTFISLDKSWNKVMAYLHDTGAVFYFRDLDFVVINPHWFAHVVDDYLSDSLQPGNDLLFRPAFRSMNGLLTVEVLRTLLEVSLIEMGLDQSLVTIERFIQLMLKLNLCCEQVHKDARGNKHRIFLFPILLGDIGARTRWSPIKNKEETCRFVGCRLQCHDINCTFFTPGFFPRLQVEMYNWCLHKGWITQDQINITTPCLRANVFQISVQGHDLILEHSGDAGYFVDIMVRSFKSYSKAMAFVRNQVIALIRDFCVSGKGCIGVTLEEHLIRRKCVQALTSCKYRTGQSILWTDLREKIRDSVNKVYIQHWPHVACEDDGSTLILEPSREYAILVENDTMGEVQGGSHCKENDIVILGESLNEVSALLDTSLSTGAVEQKVYYPNTRVEQGKRRGLALVISMEANRPGRSVDRGRLETLAESTCFTSDVMVDATAAEICSHVKQLAEDAALNEDDCFLCCVNSHGGIEDGEHFIMDKNQDKIFLVRDILQPFKQSKHLVGKPKVFIINACRGDSKHRGRGAAAHQQEAVNMDAQISAGADVTRADYAFGCLSCLGWPWLWRAEEPPRADYAFGCLSCLGTRLYNHVWELPLYNHVWELPLLQPSGDTECLTFLEHLTDSLIVLSTTENSVSWREPLKGTVFVQALVEAFVTGCQTNDVNSILDVVNKQVTDNIAKERDSSSGTLNTYRQSIVVRHTLTRKIYWGRFGV